MKTLIAKTVAALLIATPAIACAQGFKMSTYSAIVDCVEKNYEYSMWDSPENERNAFLSEVLALKGQPSYSEANINKINKDQINTSEYMLVYVSCISGDLNEKIVKIGAKYGIEQNNDY